MRRLQAVLRKLRKVEDPRSIHFREVGELLSFIAGGEDKHLTAEQLNRWYDLIVYAVTKAFSGYSSCRGRPTTGSTRSYYIHERKTIGKAKSPEELLKILEGLRTAIKYE